MGLAAAAAAIAAASVFFSMFGKGGGEFYLPIIIAALGLPYYVAAGTTLFILVAQGASMVAVYHSRLRLLDWMLAAIAGGVAAASSFAGGFVAGSLSARTLRLVFAALLYASAVLIYRGLSARPGSLPGPRLERRVGGIAYQFNPLAAAAPVSLVAFLAGMAGISGGSLIVPILVVLGGVPLRVAIGSNSFLVLASASSAFLGHLARGGFDPRAGAVLAAVAVAGAQVGARLHARLSDRALRLLFSALMAAAATWMLAR